MCNRTRFSIGRRIHADQRATGQPLVRHSLVIDRRGRAAASVAALHRGRALRNGLFEGSSRLGDRCRSVLRR